MGLDIQDARLVELVDADAEMEWLASGCQFTEGAALERRWEVSAV